MKVLHSGAKYSNIVSIGEMLKQKQVETGLEYLQLNRGVNAVCNIDLCEVVKLIDFNSTKLQVYPANNGIDELKAAINTDFFANKANPDHIVVTHGGMGSLDLMLAMLDIEKVYFAKYYWGSYRNVAIIHGRQYDYYESLTQLREMAPQLAGSAVIICDPNNPIGNKYDDQLVLDTIAALEAHNVVTLFDSPYRRLFTGDNDAFYQELLRFPNVVIMDSFSKAFGISGQRIGFVHCQNKEFIHELGVRMLYIANGVNAFAQLLVTKLITSPEGRKATTEFRRATVEGIRQNIAYLAQHGLLAEEFYQDSEPVGIFVIVNKTEAELLEHRIGSVQLSYFTNIDKEAANRYARICVSVPHAKFVEFFAPVAQRVAAQV